MPTALQHILLRSRTGRIERDDHGGAYVRVRARRGPALRMQPRAAAIATLTTQRSIRRNS
jgi:hypothetical protein